MTRSDPGARDVARERLRLLYELNRDLTTFADLRGLLAFATEKGRELFQAEGCAILMLDSRAHEFYFPVASDTDAQSEAKLTELRFPATQGIAGWVLAHDRAELVADTSRDERFYRGVDQQTRMTTRSLLCAPLRTRSGNIGVMEVVNPAPQFLTQIDLEFLETVAADVAIACEKARLYERLREEALSLRQVCRVAGVSLGVAGLVLSLGAAVGHLGRALPLVELAVRPNFIVGLVATLGGSLLTAIARGWLVPPAETGPRATGGGGSTPRSL